MSDRCRTRETLARTGIDAPVQYVERLYDSTPGIVIDQINGVGAEVSTLLGRRTPADDQRAGAATGRPRHYQNRCGRTDLDEIPDIGDAAFIGSWATVTAGSTGVADSGASRMGRPAPRGGPS